MKRILPLALAALTALGAAAQEPWVHVYGNYTEPNSPSYGPEKPDDKPTTTNTHRFVSLPMSQVDSIRVARNKAGTRYMTLKVYHDGKTESIAFSSLDHWTIGANVPQFNITIPADTELPDVTSKDFYLKCTLDIDGRGVVEDFHGDSLRIRGRGNSTWSFPKKAYRLKLPEKTKLCGFRKAKNYVLLANYIDVSFMRNQAACLFTQLAGMPYPTHAMPVDVTFNGQYKGSYMLTEKVGLNNGSVNIPKEQEARTCMFELDTQYDEELREMSPLFRLPVMHKDPDVPDSIADPKAWFSEWMEEFNAMEEAVYFRKDMADYIDYETLARYLLVYNLACNQELNHPKSVYLYKTRGEGQKFQFGPCWDFDWAFGYQPTYRSMSAAGEMPKDEADALFNAAVDYMKQHEIEPGWFFEFNGYSLLMLQNSGMFICYQDGEYVYNWPYGTMRPGPSYNNFLLGVGQNNQNTAEGMGNGGEFFMSIIKDNPEFMKVYARLWEDFKTRLPEFWEGFDAYARMLEPSADRDATIWNDSYYSPAVDNEFREMRPWHPEAVQVLRTWIEKRLEFIGDASMNYGLYDPETKYEPAYTKY